MEMAQEIVSKGFNPRSPCGERRFDSREKWSRAMFQPTLPLRGATGLIFALERMREVSTHAPLAGSDLARALTNAEEFVSTHAPLAGSDYAGIAAVITHSGFNPRSPCGERLLGIVHSLTAAGFNPRSPCGERHKSNLPIFAFV